jgi:hypothetical protein
LAREGSAQLQVWLQGGGWVLCAQLHWDSAVSGISGEEATVIWEGVLKIKSQVADS